MTTAPASASRAVGAATIAEAFRITAEDHPDRVAVRTKDDEVSLTWSELRDRVDALARGLHELGVRRGDTVALMLANRPEFHIADLAAMTLGATPFSIYATSSPEQIAYVVGDAEAKVAIVEEAFAGQFLHARAELPDVETVIVLEGAQGEGDAGVGRRRGDRVRLRRRRRVARGRARGPDHADLHVGHDRPAEGRPARPPQPDGGRAGRRGADPLPRRLEGHLLAAERAHRRADGPPLPADRLRDDDHLLPEPARGRRLPAGGQADLVLRRAADLGEAQGRHGGRSWPRARAASRSARGSTPRCARSSSSRPASRCPDDLAATVAEADEQLFSGIRAMLGFDEVAAVNVGAAPTPREVLVFFHAIGVPLAELWGMSETCGAGCCNPPEKIKIGTVGPAAPGVEVKLGEDGELLMRSDVVMTGYRNLPGPHVRGARRRRLAAHGRHRDDRRRRLRLDRRPQEGADHQRGGQEHVAREHRVAAQGREPADRPGVRASATAAPTTRR